MFDNILHAASRLFRMEDETWERHASPWSVWTRVATAPLIAVALWSPHWIGWWSVVPIAVLLVWVWLNPRLFPKPASTQSWASRAVMGERVFLARKTVPIPAHHVRTVNILGGISAAGGLVMLVSLIMAWPIGFVAGWCCAILAKMWFCDRMVWLFEDMSAKVPEYAAWRR